MHLTSIAPDFSLLSDVLKERDLTGVFAYARIDSSLINARSLHRLSVLKRTRATAIPVWLWAFICSAEVPESILI